MLDANDILSGLGQDHVHEVMKFQDIKPEKNMVRIEDTAQDLLSKPPIKKDLTDKETARKDQKSLKDTHKTKTEKVNEILKAELPKKEEKKAIK